MSISSFLSIANEVTIKLHAIKSYCNAHNNPRFISNFLIASLNSPLMYQRFTFVPTHKSNDKRLSKVRLLKSQLTFVELFLSLIVLLFFSTNKMRNMKVTHISMSALDATHSHNLRKHFDIKKTFFCSIYFNLPHPRGAPPIHVFQ